MREAPSAAVVSRFLDGLSEERRREVQRVRALIRRHLPDGYEESVAKGLLVYHVPLERYRDKRTGDPVWYIALGCTKAGLSLHLMPIYASPQLTDKLVDGFQRAGKKLDMGKACIRFKTADDLVPEVIGEIVGAITPDRWIAIVTAAHRR